MSEIERLQARAKYTRVPAGAAVEIHPAVVDLAHMADVRYLAADMLALTSLCADYLALVEPVIAVLCRKRYLVVAGFRSWQVATIMRRHEHGLFVLLLGGRIDDDTARAIAVYDVMVHRMLTSLDRTGAHQIDHMARLQVPDYRRPAAGRPSSATRASAPPVQRFFNGALSTPMLAQVMGLPPSTLRRGRHGT